MSLLEQIFNAGVIGAGGAGFPTSKKLVEGVKLLVVNAAECEPLLASDRYVMRTFADEIIEALIALQAEFGIKRVVIGTKEKYTREIAALQQAIDSKNAGFEIHTVSSFYPAGDEQILIYEITGESVPPGGIPLALGIVVINVTTAHNIYRAMQGIPVTQRYVTVTGQVGNPVLVDTPVGTSLADCIEAAGGTGLDDFTIVKGGPMMGRQLAMEPGLKDSIGKADGGLIVLDTQHPYIQFSHKTIEHMVNQAKSVCIQCSYCTEMCPRYLIGHKMRPHKVMRSMATQRNGADLLDALLCCECGICELFSCPMMLSPRRINIYVKGLLREQGASINDKNVYEDQRETREYRRIAQSRFINRLSLTDFPTEIDEIVQCKPSSVRIPTKHGIGRLATPVVNEGDEVKAGDVIAEVGFEDVGCMVHASIAGRVAEVTGSHITIKGDSL